MDCPTAQPLIEDFYYSRNGILLMRSISYAIWWGSHYQFASAKRHTEQARVTCKVARLALENTVWNIAAAKCYNSRLRR